MPEENAENGREKRSHFGREGALRGRALWEMSRKIVSYIATYSYLFLLHFCGRILPFLGLPHWPFFRKTCSKETSPKATPPFQPAVLLQILLLSQLLPLQRLKFLAFLKKRFTCRKTRANFKVCKMRPAPWSRKSKTAPKHAAEARGSHS